jgi:hypothetical protein
MESERGSRSLVSHTGIRESRKRLVWGRGSTGTSLQACFVQGVATVTAISVVNVDTDRARWNQCHWIDQTVQWQMHAVERGADVTTTFAASSLTATDRCDRCGAQAYVRAIMPSGSELLFCAHHWRDNEPRLREVAASIQDESVRLAEVPAIAPLDER